MNRKCHKLEKDFPSPSVMIARDSCFIPTETFLPYREINPLNDVNIRGVKRFGDKKVVSLSFKIKYVAMDIVLLVIILLLLVGFGIGFYYMHKHYEQELKRETKRAQKSELLKSVFIENISRALRTPEKATLGYSNLILEGKNEYMDPAQVKEMAAHIRNNSAQVLGFIQHLVDLSKYEGITPAYVY